MNNAEKFGQMFLAIGLFVGVMAVVLLIADRAAGQERRAGQRGRVPLTRGAVAPGRAALPRRSHDHRLVPEPARHRVRGPRQLRRHLHRVAVPDRAAQHLPLGAVHTDHRHRHRAAVRGACRPGAWGGRRQGVHLPAGGHLACRCVDHLEVRLRVPAGGRQSDRTGQPDLGLARARSLSVLPPLPVEHAVHDRHHDLDPGGLRHDGALRGDQGDSRRHHRGREA